MAEELTVEKLRTFPGFEQYSDKRAENVVRTINALAQVLYNNYKHQKMEEPEKQQAN